MPRIRNEELLNAAAGELVQELFASLKEIGKSLTLPQMRFVMERLEKKCGELCGNGKDDTN